MLSRERRLFFLRWLKSPRRVGVPVPSSKGLAQAMAAQLSALLPEDYVVELGPGTGVVTRALLAAGVRPEKLIIIERDSAFMEKLKADFPGTLLLQENACHLKVIIERLGVRQVAAVISSLPLLSLPDQVRQTVIHEAFTIMKPNGIFIQYTYGLLSPVPVHLQRAVGIRGRIAKHIWRNFPPARVWRYTAEPCA